MRSTTSKVSVAAKSNNKKGVNVSKVNRRVQHTDGRRGTIVAEAKTGKYRVKFDLKGSDWLAPDQFKFVRGRRPKTETK